MCVQVQCLLMDILSDLYSVESGVLMFLTIILFLHIFTFVCVNIFFICLEPPMLDTYIFIIVIIS